MRENRPHPRGRICNQRRWDRLFSLRLYSQQTRQQPRRDDVDRRDAGDNVRSRASDDGCCGNVPSRDADCQGTNGDNPTSDHPTCDNPTSDDPTCDNPTNNECAKGGHCGFVLCTGGRKKRDLHRCSDGLFGDQGGRNGL